MCEPVTAAMFFTSMFSTALSSRAARKQGDAMQVPQPSPIPQATKLPEFDLLRKRLMGGGTDPTALTGPSGVSKDKLLLGKATVLGG